MAETSDAVRRCIEQDVFLQEALARGIVKYRELARWLKENRGVEGKISAIAAAAQRHRPDAGSEAMANAWKNLKDARIDHKGGLGALVISITEDSMGALPRLLRLTDPSRGDSFRILHDDGLMTFVLQAQVLPQAREAFGDQWVEEGYPDVAELRIVPADGTRLEPSVLGLAIACLAVNGVGTVFAQASPTAHSIFVEARHGQEAFDLMEELTGS